MKLFPTGASSGREWGRRQPSKFYTFVILGALATGLGIWIVARKAFNLLLS